jgi:hypothetical protein
LPAEKRRKSVSTDGSVESRTRYPEVCVRLVGEDGNAFAIMGRVTREMRRKCVPREERDKFMAEAMSGDYDNLLQTCVRWVTVT